MVRSLFYWFTAISLIVIFAVSFFWPPVLWFLIIVIPIIIRGIVDLSSKHHNILHNYPVLGHFRYMFEFIRPEIQQYFVATNVSGRPFSREQRSIVYQRAKNVMDTHPFGTEHNITDSGYLYAYHSMNTKTVDKDKGRVIFGGAECSQPYSASLINISAMSFGALSRNAIMALNLGAKLANIYHNTGEGGLTDHHLSGGGDLVWQLGTGYFGCRTADGGFDQQLFVDKASLDICKMIEIKISQGAKPSHGGVLPADKIDEEISHFRGVPMGEDCLSPPTHREFDTPIGLLHFVQRLRELTHGKPIGFKLALGIPKEFMAICKAMLETKIYPDFITIDGAEGGTGAAPLVFTNRLGMPGDHAIAFAHNCLVGAGLRDKIRLINSAKIVTSFDILKKLALGANTVNMARPFMFSIGCIQAVHCNTNKCPTGVTSNDPKRYQAIDIDLKSQHVRNFHHHTLHSVLELAGAMGFSDPQDITADSIRQISNNVEDIGGSITLHNYFHFIEPEQFLSGTIQEPYKSAWLASSANEF